MTPDEYALAQITNGHANVLKTLREMERLRGTIAAQEATIKDQAARIAALESRKRTKAAQP